MRRNRAPGREARDIHDDRGGRRGGEEALCGNAGIVIDVMMMWKTVETWAGERNVDKRVLVLNSVDDIDPEYQYYNERKQGGERKAFRA